MKFDHLLASIDNHSEEQPSLFMALCMVESLIADIEDACGTDIEYCPVGDENLPSKLVMLSRIIMDIYKEKNEELQRNRSRLDAAMEKLNDTQRELESLSDAASQMQSLRVKKAALDRELEDRRDQAATCKNLELACQQAQQQLEELQRFDIDAVRQEKEILEAQIALLQSDREGIGAQIRQAKLDEQKVRQDCDHLREQYNSLIQSISRKKLDQENQERKLLELQQSVNDQESKKQRLEAELNAHILKLEEIQKDVTALEEENLPDVLKLQQQEQERKDKLSQKVEAAEKQRDFYQQEITRLEEVFPKLEKDLSEEKAVYDAMTAKLVTHSKELEELKEQIRQLQGNSQAEQLESFRNQLADKKQQLNQIQEDCEKLEEENSLMAKKLDEYLAERTKLEDVKRTYETGHEAVRKQLKELEFAKEPRYAELATAMQERVKLLQEVRGKLQDSLTAMSEILCRPVVADTDILEEVLQNNLTHLGEYIEKMRKALLACAKSIKLEETK